MRGDADERLGILARLFAFGADVALADAERALAPVALDALTHDGILERRAGRVTALIRIDPYQGLLVAHDPEEAGAIRPDHVLGVGGASRMLAMLTVRRPIERALDIGAGSGVQTLLAARHAARVTGVDVNPRALALARLNLDLNEVANIDLLEGSLFEPVTDQQFDLIVANPPFVISPDSAYVFRDSGEARDALSERVIAGATEHLREGGFATIVCNWIHAPGENWSARLRSWVEGRGCDAWLLHYGSDDPADYAVRWNLPLRQRDLDEFASAVSRWRRYYEDERIGAIATGAVILRKRAGANWTRHDEMPFAPTASASDHILRVFAAQDTLATIEDDSALLGQRFALVDRHHLDQTLAYGDGQYTVESARLLLDEGAGVPGPLALHAIHVLFRLDGRRTLHEAIEQAAEDTGLEHGLLQRDALETARRLFALGYLTQSR